MQSIRRPRLFRHLPAPLALILVLATSSRLAAQQPERYPVSGHEVAIYNLAGEVRVESGPGPDVVAEVTRGGSDAAKLKVIKSEIDGTQTLRFVYPSDRIRYAKLSPGSSTQLRVRDNGTFNDSNHDEEKREEGRRVTISGGTGGGLDAYADLRITVPMGKQVALYLAVGKVSVTNVEGNISVDASSAPVTTSNTRGELNIDVGSGSVQVTQSRGELSIDTGSGPVSVSDVSGESVSIDTGSGMVTGTGVRSSDLSIETGSGDIQMTGLTAPQVKLNTGSGTVTADVTGELWNLSVETGSGDITLKVPPTIGAEVDIETSSGEIETDFEVAVTRHARDHMTGRIGDGRGKIDIETGSGGIKLVKGS
jgi:lia operon protein LiaG